MNIPFEKSFASHEMAKNWSTKNELKSTDVFKFSGKKAIFNCDICNHEFHATISNISNGQWCGYCNGDKLCNSDICSFCYNKSFASSIRSQYWSTLNNTVPRSVMKYSHKKYIFNCNKCTHQFSISLDKIEHENAWCPYCSNKLCNDNECSICFNNSFANHPRAKYWSIDNDITPRDVRRSSSKKYKFNCDACSHTFIAPLNNVCRTSWCPYCCVNSTTICEDDSCNRCFNKSFASYPLIDRWSPNNILIPRQVFKKTDKKYLFICNNCNLEYSIRLLSMVYGSGCSYCKNKTEKILYDWLIKEYNTIIFQPKYDWCKNPKTNRHLPFDFEYNNIIIELDGPQHFRQVSNWRSPEEQLELDKYKMQCAINNNKCIIRLLQINVLQNINNWTDKLKDSISTLLITSDPSICYIGIDPSHFT
jgi:hypothetical protein